MPNLWDDLTVGLEFDERVVYPEMYVKNRHLYDTIVGIAWLVKDRSNNARLDWVWDGALERVLKEHDVEILAKQLVVRIRLPWNEVEEEWLCSQEELNNNREEYAVIDIFLRVREKTDPGKIFMVNPLEFEMYREKYDIVDVRYLVMWKESPEVEKRLLGIDPDRFKLYMQQ